MKSIKPGRGPSMMGGISALFAALFGVFWIIVVLQSGGRILRFLRRDLHCHGSCSGLVQLP